MAADSQDVVAHVQLVDRYRFTATFPGVVGAQPITLDEAPPLGEGAGPTPAGLLAAAIGLVWFCVGNALLERRAMAGFGALGEAIEKTLQILVNTLSFARVGAFALAHAGLSSAVVTLMTAADNVFARAAILIVGNAVVIVLEAMVVSIQTTRLVLFEFFSRFMQGQGRAFRPLPAPPFVYQETSR